MRDTGKLFTKRITLIAKVGAELFSTKGFAETSMDDIAASAKLSKGGIYHYYASKIEILNDIVQTFMDVVLKDLNEELAKADNGLGKINKLIFRHIELYTKHMYEAKTLLNEAHNLPSKYRKKIVVKEREYFRITAGLVHDYFGASMEKAQVTVITFSLLGVCNWIYSWYNPKGPINPAHLSEMIFDLFSIGVSGLLKKHD